ncbi:MAG: acylphosphatase [Thermodesulfobacterium geofontis]|uniref:Acylphosphatase n=2 Tax=Thermodesulfobacterium geofontis TaxID=1295609 RepID=A0A2N7PMI6_9BACT|nr:MAG: acylphosphatase [Thermodesulfobacterium geofontis]
MKRVHVFISGKVQGVWFRSYTEAEAKKLGIKGWVRNLPDGRVEAVFEGEDSAVDKMVTWCHKGSPYAKVENVEVIEEPYKGEFTDFKIRY